MFILKKFRFAQVIWLLLVLGTIRGLYDAVLWWAHGAFEEALGAFIFGGIILYFCGRWAYKEWINNVNKMLTNQKV